ncbi:hypothetical protein JCGZ_20770 [Jatropha curcas]|uniref:Bifunctional inhibitor/plant lipid transfer protein/seed storage helical domain-containing protein n=1 Tax=Jatropha curcas TaxID=180498 RepID=A0A067K1E9_JATCU|nr:non-specific lipid-transfer protein [Jatropha curcas]KDP25614.1 hypothetical protein JCGZ_20770 [Jatropha curcas]
MASLTMSTAAMMVAILFVSTTTIITQAQNIPSCAQKLIPCAEYISNTTVTPPSTCCNPIKEAVNTERACLCNLYNTPGLLSGFGINVTQALGLTKRCGVSTDLSACSKAEAPTAGAGTPPPGVPGNDGSRMAWTGFSSLVLLWASYSLIY